MGVIAVLELGGWRRRRASFSPSQPNRPWLMLDGGSLCCRLTTGGHPDEGGPVECSLAESWVSGFGLGEGLIKLALPLACGTAL